MSRGSIVKRGKNSYRLKWDMPAEGGNRVTRYATVRGKRADAERRLIELLRERDTGTSVDPSTVTVAEYLRGWLGDPPKDGEPPSAPPAGLTPKTAERYRELAEGQIIPHLGDIALQKLRPARIEQWHVDLLKAGSKRGKPLSPTTVQHAHRVLHKALKRATKTEIVSRNVAAVISPPPTKRRKVRILTSDEITDTLAKFEGHALYSLAVFDLATGMRRGELAGLRLADLDLDAGTVSVCRAVEETTAGLRVKEPKTEKGWRTLSLPPSAIAVMREHRRALLETRLKVGLGKPDADTLVFGEPDGSILRPNRLSWLWRAAVKSLGAPRVNLHALRHTYASALIAAGLDVITVQHKMGHATATTTLNTYGHLFKKDDTAAVNAIEAVLGTKKQQSP
jgi:integrase